MEKEKVTEELVRQNGNQAAAVMADYAGQGGGGGEGTTLGSVATLPLMTSEQIEAVRRAITSWGSSFLAGTYFIPATSVDELPLYYKTVGEDGTIEVATSTGVNKLDGPEVATYSVAPRVTRTFVRVDGGYGEYNQQMT